MSKYYVLDGHEPVPTDDMMEWAKMLENTSRRVVRQEYIGGLEGTFVSTVFLGLDHSFGDGPPLLFETMSFRGDDEQELERCSTWEEAERQHEEVVERVRRRYEIPR